MEKITGYVDHIIFRNADNGYTVMVLVVEEEEITCVGNFSDIAEGENMEATGEYTEHPTYGRQFKIESYIEKAPEDELAIERYLGSGAIKGIGLALAARIVRRFKKDTFRIIELINGINQSKNTIADQIFIFHIVTEIHVQTSCNQFDQRRIFDYNLLPQLRRLHPAITLPELFF